MNHLATAMAVVTALAHGHRDVAVDLLLELNEDELRELALHQAVLAVGAFTVVGRRSALDLDQVLRLAGPALAQYAEDI